MKTWIAGATMVALAVLSGCSAVPVIDSSEEAAAITGVGDPFVFMVNGESLDAEPVPDGVLTVSEAVKRCLAHSPRIQQALARVRISQAEAGQTRLLPNPVLSLSLRFPESGQTIIDAGLTAELLSLFQRPGRIDAADNRLRAAAAELLVVVLDELAAIEEQYATVQSLDAEQVVLNTRRALVEQLAELTRSRLRAGEGSQLDVLTAESELASLDADLAEKSAASRIARIGLARLIGTPSSHSTWVLSPWESAVVASGTESQWVSAALQRRPEIQAVTWELSALGDEVRLAKLSPLDGSDIGVAAERDGDWSVGPAINIGIPVFDFGQAKREIADGRRVEMRHKLTEVRRLVVEQTRTAIEQLRSTQDTLALVRQSLLPVQEKRLSQAQATFRAGLVDITAVRLAEQDLQGTRAKLIELELRVSLARIKLERAVGGPGVAAAIQPSSSTQPTASGDN
jgi:outer membrane protein TolC